MVEFRYNLAMRLVGIHQPHYLPWLRYIEKIARSDVFILLDTVQYTKNGWQKQDDVCRGGAIEPC